MLSGCAGRAARREFVGADATAACGEIVAACAGHTEETSGRRGLRCGGLRLSGSPEDQARSQVVMSRCGNAPGGLSSGSYSDYSAVTGGVAATKSAADGAPATSQCPLHRRFRQVTTNGRRACFPLSASTKSPSEVLALCGSWRATW